MRQENFQHNLNCSVRPTITIKHTDDTRYVIADSNTGALIEDAQGYGFSTHEKAYNYAIAHGWDVTNPPCNPEINSLF